MTNDIDNIETAEAKCCRPQLLTAGSLDEYRFTEPQQVETAYPVDHAALLAIVHLRDQLAKANARVATLEAECVAWRNRLRIDNISACRGRPNEFGEMHAEAAVVLRKAIAATGPIGGVA